MQHLTPRLIEAYESLSDHKVTVHVDEGDEYFRLEAALDKFTVENLNHERLERAAALVPPHLQKVHFDVSALGSHELVLTHDAWKENLRKYLEDAQLLEEPWTARITVTLDKKAVVQETHLQTKNFDVIPIFLVSTLLNKQRLPIADQLRALFPARQKKSVFVMLDKEIFLDGPFLCFTDWGHIEDVSYSGAPFLDATKRVEIIQQECSWQGSDRVYLPDFLEFKRTTGNLPEVMDWLQSLRGALGLFAIANVTVFESKRTELTFWGIGKRQVTLNGTGMVNKKTAEGSHALYSWVYQEVPHPNAALRISRNSVSQHLGSDPESNIGMLETGMPDIMASAKANYAAFVQEKLEDFFELGKDISSYTTSAAEYLYKTLGDLNESLRKSVYATLGVIAGTLVSTTAVQLNPMTYTVILAGYGLFLLFFNGWYAPRVATAEFADHLRRFRNRLEPYREFLSKEQRHEVLEEVPLQNKTRFIRTRRLVQAVNCVLAGLVLCLSGFDVPSIAKSFRFVPTWALGRAVDWVFKYITRYL